MEHPSSATVNAVLRKGQVSINQTAQNRATMFHMKSSAADEREAIRAIIKIIRDQKALEKHQRSKRASVNTLQDSMVYAYDQIVEVVEPFMEDEG